MASLGQLLGENKFLKLQANNKILCDVTGHEMSARGDVVQAYINGKKFKKELEWYKHDYSEFLPYIVEDKNNSKKLYCKLTRQTLNKIPEEVRKHMQGKRFKRLVAEELLKPAKEIKKKAVKRDESDDEDSLDPRIVKELIGEVEEAVPATKKAKRSAKGDDNMSDLLGSDAEEGGSDVDSDAEIEDDDEEEEEEDEDESEQEEGNGNGSDDDASSKEDARFNKKGTRVGVKKQLIAQGKKPSKHSSRGGAKGKVVKAKSNGKAAGAKGKRRA